MNIWKGERNGAEKCSTCPRSLGRRIIVEQCNSSSSGEKSQRYCRADSSDFAGGRHLRHSKPPECAKGTYRSGWTFVCRIGDLGCGKRCSECWSTRVHSSVRVG